VQQRFNQGQHRDKAGEEWKCDDVEELQNMEYSEEPCEQIDYREVL
jgi:hypothetical protein